MYILQIYTCIYTCIYLHICDKYMYFTNIYMYVLQIHIYITNVQVYTHVYILYILHVYITNLNTHWGKSAADFLFIHKCNMTHLLPMQHERFSYVAPVNIHTRTPALRSVARVLLTCSCSLSSTPVSPSNSRLHSKSSTAARIDASLYDIYICICMYICTHTYIYIYMYIYIYI